MPLAKWKARDDKVMLHQRLGAAGHGAHKMLRVIYVEREERVSRVPHARSKRENVQRPPPPFSSPTSETQGPSMGKPHLTFEHSEPLSSCQCVAQYGFASL